MSLEDDIAQSLAEKMAKDIDKELLDDMMISVLKDEGWTETKINPAFPPIGMMSGSYEQWYSQTAEWIHLNATDDYKLLKGQWLFKNKDDAIMFILRWS